MNFYEKNNFIVITDDGDNVCARRNNEILILMWKEEMFIHFIPYKEGNKVFKFNSFNLLKNYIESK